ncbi:outer membrane protein A [Burkholderiales bacterium GJ-E10]|nr:outer membrane protein A [Burkholderiales bacterium GJ-E10]
MNMQTKMGMGALVFAVAASAATVASAQGMNAPTASNAGYWGDSGSTVVRDPYGLCWHSGSYSDSDALIGCDRTAPPPAAPKPAPKPMAKAAPAPAPVVTKPAVLERVTFGSDALFAFDHYNLKPAARARLDALVQRMHGARINAIHVVGYTDSIGTEKYNQKLSERRANSVRNYLIQDGVPADIITAEGRGKHDFVASNKTAAGRAKNRRVEVEVDGSRTVMR